MTFSESVSGVNAADFALATSGLGGAPAISGVTGGPTVYTVTASTGTGSGTLGLNLNDDDSIADAAGNKLGGTGTGTAGSGGAGNGSFTGEVYTVDRNNPTVSSIAARSPTRPTPRASSWTVTFSESVSGVNAADFALATSGLGGAPAITGVTGGPTVYTVTASTGTGSGTLGLNLNDDDSITDAAGNKLGGTGTGTAGSGGAGNGSFTGEVYTVDRTPPSVTIDQAMGQTDPTSVSPINFKVTFAEDVTGFTSADVSTTGSTAGGSLSVAVSGGPKIYNVSVSGMTTSGTVKVSFGAGAAMDTAGNGSVAPSVIDDTVTWNGAVYVVSFQSPLDTSTTVPPHEVINVGKNGRVIPVKVKITLNGVEVTPTNAGGPVTIEVVKKVAACSSADSSDVIEEYAAGNSNTDNIFRWTNGTWMYNWDTKASNLSVGGCYRINVWVGATKASVNEFALFQPTK